MGDDFYSIGVSALVMIVSTYSYTSKTLVMAFPSQQ